MVHPGCAKVEILKETTIISPRQNDFISDVMIEKNPYKD